MCDTDSRHREQSRHYDTLQWTVSGIFLSAIGFLYIHVLDDYRFPLALAGAALTLACVFFTTSFRHLRKKAQSRLSTKEEEDEFRNDAMFKQWPVSGFIQWCFYVAWICVLWRHHKEYCCIWFVCGVLGTAFIVFYYYQADQDPKADQPNKSVRTRTTSGPV